MQAERGIRVAFRMEVAERLPPRASRLQTPRPSPPKLGPLGGREPNRRASSAVHLDWVVSTESARFTHAAPRKTSRHHTNTRAQPYRKAMRCPALRAPLRAASRLVTLAASARTLRLAFQPGDKKCKKRMHKVVDTWIEAETDSDTHARPRKKVNSACPPTRARPRSLRRRPRRPPMRGAHAGAYGNAGGKAGVASAMAVRFCGSQRGGPRVAPDANVRPSHSHGPPRAPPPHRLSESVLRNGRPGRFTVDPLPGTNMRPPRGLPCALPPHRGLCLFSMATKGRTACRSSSRYVRSCLTHRHRTDRDAAADTDTLTSCDRSRPIEHQTTKGPQGGPHSRGHRDACVGAGKRMDSWFTTH